MNLQKIFIIFFTIFLISSCAVEKFLREEVDKETAINFNVVNENMLRARGSYNAYLALEYLDFARNLAQGNNKKDARFFLNKAVEAASDKEVIPENPLDWDADPAQIEELVAMQKRMELVSNPQIQNRLPIQMAHLTYLYDCWSAKESKPIFRAGELAKCRGRFYKLLEEIEFYLDDLKKDLQPATVIESPKFKHFEILFDLSSYKLNDVASKDFLEILKYLLSMNGDYRILLVGNADRTGVELLNQNLALKRVETVKNYLIKNGVTSDLIEQRSFGEDFPDILTAKGSQEQSNRSVGIYVLKGAKSFDTYPLPLIENFVYREELEKARHKRGLK